MTPTPAPPRKTSRSLNGSTLTVTQHSPSLDLQHVKSDFWPDDLDEQADRATQDNPAVRAYRDATAEGDNLPADRYFAPSSTLCSVDTATAKGLVTSIAGRPTERSEKHIVQQTFAQHSRATVRGPHCYIRPANPEGNESERTAHLLTKTSANGTACLVVHRKRLPRAHPWSDGFRTYVQEEARKLGHVIRGGGAGRD